MLKKQTLKETVGHSPFKFLKAYQKDEADLFFGRKVETEHLISAFKKSSFVILYGPSGSGKSSLINCGLIKGINAEKVYEIRRDQHILTAIQRQLFDDLTGLPENHFVKITQDFYRVKSNIATNLKEIEQIKKAILIANAKYQRGKINRQALTEQIDGFKLERKDLQVSLDAYQVLETQLEKDFIELMNRLLRHLKASPYLIFDQFEEIFIFGSQAEIEAFGAFLAGLLDNNIPFKILLTVREEYFSRLGIFEKYLPQILYRNSFIDNPDRQTIAQIIRKSFQQFNINQYYQGEDWTRLKPIPEQEQEDRIYLIIDQLTPVNEQNENNVDLVDRNKKYHLPFLQIYLDKLYRKDFRKTYPIKPIKNLPTEFNGYLPLEFELEEIKNFGNIDEVLKKYLHQVNQELVFSSKVKGFLGENGQNIIVKFLKFFTTNDNTKKRIKINFKLVQETEDQPIDASETILFLENKQLSNQIQMSLWGEVNESFYLPEISRILIQLDTNYRLLKISQEYVELSHDVLAKIINQYHIDSDLREIYKDQFEYSYRVYEKMGTIEQTHLSSRQVIQYEDENNARTLEYILSDPKKTRALKKKIYWRDSKAIVQLKREKEIRKRNFIILSFFLLSLIMGCNLYSYKKQSDELAKKSEDLEDSKRKSGAMSEKSGHEGKIYKGTGDAFKNMNKDRTNTYNKIIQSETGLREYNSLLESIKKYLNVEDKNENFFIGDIKNEFYKDFNQYPVYSKNLKFEGPLSKNKIKQTKTIISKTNKDSIHIFLQTPDNELFVTSTNYTAANTGFTKRHFITDTVSQFLPYYDDQNRLCVLLIKNDSLYKSIVDSTELTLLKYEQQSLNGATALIQLSDNEFVTNNTKGALEFVFKDTLSITWQQTGKGIKQAIKDLQPYSNNEYLVIGEKKAFKTQFGRQYLYGFEKVLTNHNVIKGTDQNKFFIGEYEKIVTQSNVYSTKWLPHNHEDAINSIDYYASSKKELLLLGSQDRTASIWDNNKRIRTLIGHTDEILHASFINSSSPYYALTVSADRTLKIWDMRPIERRIEKVKKVDEITKLKFNKKDSLLYIGFAFKNTQNPDGFLYSVCENLDLLDECCTKKIIQQVESDDKLGHLTAFDFGLQNQPIVGTNWTGLIAGTNANSSSLRISGNEKMNDLVIRDSLMALARPNGIRFYPNYTTTRKREYADKRDTLKNIHFNAIAIHPNLPIIAGAAANNLLYIWNVESNIITSFNDHSDEVMDVTFSKSGQYLLTGSKDNKSILWEGDASGNYTKKSTYAHHTSDIEDVEFYQDSLFLTASRDHTVQIYEKKGEAFEQYPSLIRHDTKITAATFSLDGQHIYSGDDKGYLKKWKFVDFEADIKERIPQLED